MSAPTATIGIQDMQSEFERKARAVTWSTEARDIAETLLVIRSPHISTESAEHTIRLLLGIAKAVAFGEGAKYGLNIGEQVSSKALEETRAILTTPRGNA